MNQLLNNLRYAQKVLAEDTERLNKIEVAIAAMFISNADLENIGVNWQAFDDLVEERQEKQARIRSWNRELADHNLPLLELVGESLYKALKKRCPINSDTCVEQSPWDWLRGGKIVYHVPSSRTEVGVPGDYPQGGLGENKIAEVERFVTTTNTPFGLFRLVAFAPEINTITVSEEKTMKI